MITPYATADDVMNVVHKFESCEYGPGEFHHREHVTVALCYLLESTEEEALTHMREGLLRFLKHQGATTAYHETITMFWIKRVRRFLDSADKNISLAETTNQVIAFCGTAQVILDYYSRDLLASERARTSWLEPDVKSLDVSRIQD